jgi:hypothetical protein
MQSSTSARVRLLRAAGAGEFDQLAGLRELARPNALIVVLAILVEQGSARTAAAPEPAG